MSPRAAWQRAEQQASFALEPSNTVLRAAAPHRALVPPSLTTMSAVVVVLFRSARPARARSPRAGSWPYASRELSDKLLHLQAQVRRFPHPASPHRLGRLGKRRRR